VILERPAAHNRLCQHKMSRNIRHNRLCVPAHVVCGGGCKFVKLSSATKKIRRTGKISKKFWKIFYAEFDNGMVPAERKMAIVVIWNTETERILRYFPLTTLAGAAVRFGCAAQNLSAG